MKTASPALAAYLAGRPHQVIAPDLFTFTLNTGEQLFYTNADLPVQSWGAGAGSDESGVLGLGIMGELVLGAASGGVLNTFFANSVRISGLKYSIKTGVDVDEQDVTIACRTPAIHPPAMSAVDSGVLGTGELGDMVLGEGLPGVYSYGPSTEMVQGLPFLQALATGVLDGAYLQRDRAFLPAWGAPAIGTVTLFHGRISAIEKIGRTEAQVKVKSDLVLLNIDFPRNIYQASCLHTLYDGGCTLAKTDGRWQHVGTVTSAPPNARTIPWSGGSANFAQGTIRFTSGAASGESRTIGFYDGTNLGLLQPLDAVPQPGDAFLANWGCDHTMGAQGCAKFDNLKNFRGFPYVPPPSLAL